ncbi:chemotaxis protein CheY [Sulfurifustis variabilis]|uniref:Chemotaxis protein CheY n=1 Tax=Sulfurifustis variabilis TaxID=1675686 RepID=A0A1B4VD40_9GAMM|nr:response regulator transcription factor [Sulfurifustis variabilis]BAU50181.1 chemotaxis protein CheY [Sulfurifustis variabilis]
MNKTRVLIVDDEPQIREMLAEYLSGHGYEVTAADGGEAMRTALEQSVPDVILLDVNMPGEDGVSLARHVRERFDLPIIMVTAADEVVDRVVGLEVGADDYITKPFDPRELRARLKSVLRRYRRAAEPAAAAEPEGGRVRFGRCRLDLEARRMVDGDGKEVPLTSMEFDLLRVFAERPNRVLSRDQLLTLTRNRGWDPFDRSIDIQIARLRKKIEPDPDHPQSIKTIRGAGYMYVPASG